MEEGKAEKKHETHQDSVSWITTPVSEVKDKEPSTETSMRISSILSADPLSCSPLPSQKRSSLHSTVSWDTSQLDALSQSSSNIFHSIAHETFPDAKNDDSFNCSDGSQEVQEVDELILPPVVSCSPEETTQQMVRRPLDESPFSGRIMAINSDFMPSAVRTSLGLGSCIGEKVFSLDLDQLESVQSPRREELPLPNLVTFSPIDEF